MRRITKKDGTPFPTKLSASGAVGKLIKSEGLNKEDYIIGGDKNDGFVIAAPDLIKSSQEPAVLVDAPDLSVVEVDKEVKATPSGEEPAKVKHKVTTPWKPANRVAIPGRVKDPNFAYKQVNQDKTGRVRQLETEGFEVDKTIATKLDSHERFDKNLDSTHQVNELLTMRIPIERANERKKYYSDMANGAVSQDEDATAEQLSSKAGVTMYKPKEANMNKR